MITYVRDEVIKCKGKVIKKIEEISGRKEREYRIIEGQKMSTIQQE